LVFFVLSCVYVFNALILYFKSEILEFLGLTNFGFVSICLSSIVYALPAILGHRLIRVKPVKPAWAYLDWRKVILLISLFSAMALSNGTVGILQERLTGIESVDSIPAEEYAKNQQTFLGNKLDSDSAIVLANVKKLTKTLLAAASEEVVYRWFILGTLLMFMGQGYAIVLSSVLFGLMHIFFPLGFTSDPSEIFSLAITSTVSGVFYAIIYLRAGLLYSILFHFLANLLPEFRDTALPQYIANISLAITFVGLPILLFESRFRRSSVKKS